MKRHIFLRLTKTDIDTITAECQLNSVQQTILDEYIKDNLTDEGIRFKYAIPEGLFYRNKEALFFKVEKLVASGKIYI